MTRVPTAPLPPDVVLNPSGEQFEIAFESQRAVVTELGAGIRAYAVDGAPVLDGFGAGEMATAGRGQVLAPWPNRLRDGSYEFDGRRHELPLNEPARGNAIHGLVRWAAWRPQTHESHRVVLEHILHPQPGYPFSLQLRIEYALSPSGLEVRTTATNVGASACPYGSGAHPYLTLGTESVDELRLRLPAGTALRADDRGIPIDTVPVAATELDFRAGRTLHGRKLDHGFTDLERGADGLARVELATDDGAVTLWVDEGYPYLMVFTGDHPDVMRRSLAVEPMTCAPNAFRSGEGLLRLEPGAATTSAWGIIPAQGGAATRRTA
jgi:aldose 1-epimerase